jgi:hypothetical protein
MKLQKEKDANSTSSNKTLQIDGRAAWPWRAFPSTDDLWPGSIIEKCWIKGFRNAHCLSQELFY